MAISLRRGGSNVASTPHGAMPLLEHLRELRRRLFIGVVAIVAASIAAGFFYDQLFEILKRPFYEGVRPLAEKEGLDASLTLTSAPGALTLLLKTCVVTGVVAASPVWLYQLWAFIVPALHRHERRWSVIFAAVAGPLFIGGVLIGYYVLPKGLEVLLGFTPDGVANLVNIEGYLSFVLRMLLVFGVAFEIPVFVLLLNLAGVVSGRQLGAQRPWIVVGTFVFAAIATPSTDPVSMLFLAIPMTLLFFVSEVIARAVDRRRRQRDPEGPYDAWDDDEVSALQVHHDAADESYDVADSRPSDLDNPRPEDLGTESGDDDR